MQTRAEPNIRLPFRERSGETFEAQSPIARNSLALSIVSFRRKLSVVVDNCDGFASQISGAAAAGLSSANV